MLRAYVGVALAMVAVCPAAWSVPHFTEATGEAGLLWFAMTWGAVAVDLDEDGDLDLLSGHHSQGAYLHTNDGSGHFTVWGLPQIVTHAADRHGFLFADLDGDGFADAYCTHGGEAGCACDPDPAELWRSLGQGLFEAVEDVGGMPDSLARGRAASAADIDGDGDLDIHVTKAPLALSPNALFRNDGSLQFVNVAAEWGVDEIQGTVGSLFADVDDDGDPDLLVGGEEFSRPTKLWRNDSGMFTDATFEMFGELPEIAGADFGDFDGDLDLDLAVCEGAEGIYDSWEAEGNQMWFFANYRFADDGVDAWTFRTPGGNPTANFRFNGSDANDKVFLGPNGVHPPGSAVLLTDEYVGAPQFTPGVDVGLFCWREEPGGKWEIRVSAPPGTYGNFTGQLQSAGPFEEIVAAQLENPGLSSGEIHLYRNDQGVFTDIASLCGFTPSMNPRQVQWVDYDNDGDLDLHLVNKGTIQTGNEPDRLWRNDGGTFIAVDGEVNGVAGHLSDGGVWGDFDRDGDLDLFLQEGAGPAFTSLGAPSLYYRNDGAAGHWLRVDLANPSPGQTYVGTLVTAYAGDLIVHRRARADSWRGFQAPAELHFGLGEHAVVDSIVIEWPDRQTHRVYEVAADQVLEFGGESDPTGTPALPASSAIVGRIFPQPSSGVQSLLVDPRSKGALRVRIHDVRGGFVREIFRGEVGPGERRLVWDGRDERGRLTAPGVYFWRGEGAVEFERRSVRTR